MRLVMSAYARAPIRLVMGGRSPRYAQAPPIAADADAPMADDDELIHPSLLGSFDVVGEHLFREVPLFVTSRPFVYSVRAQDALSHQHVATLVNRWAGRSCLGVPCQLVFAKTV